jgi:thiol-disulfide isomerase/thioredoxin
MRHSLSGRFCLPGCALTCTAWLVTGVAGCARATPPESPTAESARGTAAPAGAAVGDLAPDLPASTSPLEGAAGKTRKPIYNETADGRADVHAALQRAAYDHKHVLVKFGGNWCGWCYKLDDLFHSDPEIARLLDSEYEVVLVDVNSNRELLNEFDPDGRHSYPWLTVLDGSGQVLVNQNTGDLERGPEHDPERVLSFLTEWQPKPLDAAEVLTSALADAGRQNKRALVHLGAPWCGWCRVLDTFLREHQEVIGLDYVDVKIDLTRMTNAAELAQRLRGGQEGGIPWAAILDADGATLITSDGPQGNIGYPFQPHEIEHFVAMLNQTRQHLREEQVASLRQDLEQYAQTRNVRSSRRSDGP